MKDGDENAFTEIYYRYWKLLFSVAGNKLENLTDAEEAVQDVFADLWKRRLDINITHSLKAFLAGAVKFRIYSIMADCQRRKNNLRSLYRKNPSVSLSAEEAYNLKHLEEQLIKASTNLPDRCRLVYQLSREAGYSNKQIAQTLRISEKTVETQITRALKYLRTALHGIMSIF